ncbi:hypothetical protein M9H77_12107 [Catharanthus roseus]|uniref:Uncharacterized protein n=1 Tax=Catharanthus roseus TaxID=4058 RepID=A0ACC0BGM7_CATRO|nr:hypothetical protein M9H77_12107 [Catharanthus roseus]
METETRMLVQIDSSVHTFTTYALPRILKNNFVITGIFHLAFPRATRSKGIFLFDLTSRIWYMRNGNNALGQSIPIAGKEYPESSRQPTTEGKRILYLADATEESGGPPPTDVRDLALGSDNSWLVGHPKCDRSARPDQGQTSNHTGEWQ